MWLATNLRESPAWHTEGPMCFGGGQRGKFGMGGSPLPPTPDTPQPNPPPGSPWPRCEARQGCPPEGVQHLPSVPAGSSPAQPPSGGVRSPPCGGAWRGPPGWCPGRRSCRSSPSPAGAPPCPSTRASRPARGSHLQAPGPPCHPPGGRHIPASCPAGLEAPGWRESRGAAPSSAPPGRPRRPGSPAPPAPGAAPRCSRSGPGPPSPSRWHATRPAGAPGTPPCCRHPQRWPAGKEAGEGGKGRAGTASPGLPEPAPTGGAAAPPSQFPWLPGDMAVPSTLPLSETHAWSRHQSPWAQHLEENRGQAVGVFWSAEVYLRGVFHLFQTWPPPKECSWGKGVHEWGWAHRQSTMVGASSGPSAAAGCQPSLSKPTDGAAVAAQRLPKSRRCVPCLQIGRWQSDLPEAAQPAGVRAGNKTGLLPLAGWERE